MASIERSGEKWKVRWREEGAARSKTFTGERAEEEARALLATLGDSSGSAPSAEVAPAEGLRDVVKAYLRARARGLRPRGVDQLIQVLGAWLDWAEAGRLGFKALTAAEVERYHDDVLCGPTGRHGRRRAASTVRNHVRAIERLWDWADRRGADRGWTIARAVRMELGARRSPIARAPSWEEVDRMISALGSGWTWRAAVVLRYSGARIQEALRLRWADVDLDRGEVLWQPEDTKGGYGGRRVPLHPGLVELLRGWRSKSARVCDGPEAELTGRGHVQRSFNRAWRRAGVDPRVWQRQPTHAARKAFFTGLCAAGVELLLVRLLVGHKLDDTTLAYLDTAQLPLRRALERVPLITSASTPGL